MKKELKFNISHLFLEVIDAMRKDGWELIEAFGNTQGGTDVKFLKQ